MSTNTELIAKAKLLAQFFRKSGEIGDARAIDQLCNALEVAEAEHDPSKDERLVRYMAMFTPLGYSSALAVVEAMTTLLAAESLARVANAFSIDAHHLTRQRAFSADTFGPGERLAGVLDHIRKELREVEAAPDDITEWADVIILAFDGALRQGHEPQHLLDAINAKQTRNEARTWPDWRTQPLDRAIEHIAEPTTTALAASTEEAAQ